MIDERDRPFLVYRMPARGVRRFESRHSTLEKAQRKALGYARGARADGFEIWHRTGLATATLADWIDPLDRSRVGAHDRPTQYVGAF